MRLGKKITSLIGKLGLLVLGLYSTSVLSAQLQVVTNGYPYSNDICVLDKTNGDMHCSFTFQLTQDSSSETFLNNEVWVTDTQGVTQPIDIGNYYYTTMGENAVNQFSALNQSFTNQGFRFDGQSITINFLVNPDSPLDVSGDYAVHEFYISMRNSSLISGATNEVYICIKREKQDPLLTWSTETHHVIEGDFNDSGLIDQFIQPLISGGDAAIVPLEEFFPRITNYHQVWTGAHPDIADISDWSAENYQAYVSNLSAEPGDELLLLGKKELLFIPMEDFLLPIIVGLEPDNVIISWDENGIANYIAFEGDYAPEDYVVHFGDFDGDGINEILLQGKSLGSTTYLLNSDGSLRQTLANGYQGLDWSAEAYDINIVDINNDGLLDLELISKVSGVQNSFVYTGSNGDIGEDVETTVVLSDSPYANVLAGSTGGEFRVNEMGAATYSMSIPVPAGTAGVAPQIGLSYSSSGGNGPLGVGWSLNGLSAIHRCPQNYAENDSIRGVRHDTEDRFCMDGQQLFLVNNTDTYGDNGVHYRTELFSHSEIISYDTDNNLDNGPEYFTVKTRSGDTHYYGQRNAQSGDALAKTTTGAINRQWLLKRTEDLAGNYIRYNYGSASNGAEVYIDNIEYTGNDEQGLSPYNTIDFIYASYRPDNTSGYVFGSEVAQTKLLKEIKTYNNGTTESQLNRTYKLLFDSASNTMTSRLIGVQECSHLDNCMAPVMFGWSNAEAGFDKPGSYTMDNYYLNNANRKSQVLVIDIDGNGISDIIYPEMHTSGGRKEPTRRGLYAVMNGGTTGVEVYDSTVDMNYSLSNPLPGQVKIIDIEGDGVLELLYAPVNENWHYLKWNKTTEQLELKTIAGSVLPSGDVKKTFVVDLNGDALQDVLMSRSNGFEWYRQDTDGSFLPGQILSIADGSVNNLEIPDSAISDRVSRSQTIHSHQRYSRFSDFDGDGITDLMLLVENNVTYFRDTDIWGIKTKTDKHYAAFRFNPDVEQFEPFDEVGDDSLKHLNPLDINLDGLTDIMYVRDGFWRYRISDGSRFLAEERLVKSGTEAENNRFKFADYDGDGRPEVWLYSSSMKAYDIYEHKKHLAHGVWRYLKYTAREYLKGPSGETVVADILDGDFNGDGVGDILLNHRGDGGNGNHWYLWTGKVSVDAPRANMITKITSGYGVKTEIEYANLNDDASDVFIHSGNEGVSYPYIQPKLVMPVVKRVKSDTGVFNGNIEEQLSIRYQYEDLVMHVAGRGLQGFKKLKTIDEQTNIATTTEYHQEYPLSGSAKSTIQDLPGVGILSEAVNTWRVDGGKERTSTKWGRALKSGQTAQANMTYHGVFPYLESSVEKVWSVRSDTNAREFIKRVDTKNVHSGKHNYYNLLSTRVTTTDNTSGNKTGEWFEVETNNTYGSSDYEKRYARLSRVEVTKDRHNTSPVTTRSSFEYFPESYAGSDGYAGMLKTETTYLDANWAVQDVSTITENVYDAYGNQWKVMTRAKERDPITLAYDAHWTERTAESVYDAQGRFVIRAKNQLGHETTTTYESRFGGVASQTGPNGLTATTEYDELGMAIKTTAADGTYGIQALELCVGNQFVTCPDGAVYYTESQSFDSANNKLSGVSRAFFNKMGQQFVSTQTVLGNRTLVSRQEYDKYGRVRVGYLPTFGDVTTVASDYTEFVYDVFGRIVTETAPGNRTTTREYLGLTTKTTNAIGQETTEVNNINGELTQLTDSAQNTMLYSYDTHGKFLSVTDSAGNSVENTYDLAGRKIQTNDPDKGLWHYYYNGYDELVRQTDARGVSIIREYDVLGRMIRRVDNAQVQLNGSTVASVAGIETQTSCWQYDTAPKGSDTWKGRLHKTKLFAGDVSFAGNASCTNTTHTTQTPLEVSEVGYDALGRTDESTQTLKNENDSNTTSYSSFIIFETTSSRVKESVFTRNVGLSDEHDFTLENIYDSATGTLIKTKEPGSNGLVYHEVLDIDAFGNVTSSKLGNGITTTRAYNPETGYLESIVASKSGNSADILDLEQYFDNIGNVTRRNDRLLNRDEIFDYHEEGANNLLNRMTQYSVNNMIEQTYSYDALGNLKSKSDIGDDYRYGENNAGPHAVTSIYNNNNKIRDFQYDANGNLTQDTDLSDSVNNRNIDYAAFEKATRIQKGNTVIEFRYGIGRNRYRRIDTTPTGNSETTYVGNYERVSYTSGARSGEVEHKYYIAGVAMVIDTQDASNNLSQKVRYLHHDHQGSIMAITDESADVKERYRYDPFGKQHKAQDVNAATLSYVPVLSRLETTERGYTGHEMLNGVDIIHMNGRIYDANLGRFMQADAYIQAPKNMQNMNRYAYVLNNPMSYTDPSGHFFKKLKSFVKQYWRPLLSIAINIWLPGAGGWIGSGSLGATMTIGAISGVVATGTLKGGITGALSAAMFHGIGEHFNASKLKGGWEHVSSHALAGGISSVLDGGKFGHGFVSAGLTKALDVNSMIKGKGVELTAQRVVLAGIIGGTVSQITGGKFANGAITAAMAQRFNGETVWDTVTESYTTASEALTIDYLADNADRSQEIIMQWGTDVLANSLGEGSLNEAWGYSAAFGASLASGIIEVFTPTSAEDLLKVNKVKLLLKTKTTNVTNQAGGSIRNVNKVGGKQNCANCAIATDATLAGNPASALNSGVTLVSDVEKHFGRKFGSLTSQTRIADRIGNAGNGARGVVFGSRGSDTGHFFNVVNQNGTVRFLDGQTGKAADLSGFQGFSLLRTN